MIIAAPTVFLDFDGTISTRDVTDAVLEAFAAPAWRGVEEAWTAGRIGSRECLAAQTDLVTASPADLDALLDDIAIDTGFVPLVRWCRARAMPVHILSDGFDYCITRILRRPSLGLAPYLRDVTIVSSRLQPVEGRRWQASFPYPAGACVHGCATCKPAAMARLAGSGPSVFVGDGLSDRYAAGAADIVFAKQKLAAYCGKASIPHVTYNTLADVVDVLAARLAAAGQGVASGKVFPAT